MKTVGDDKIYTDGATLDNLACLKVLNSTKE